MTLDEYQSISQRTMEKDVPFEKSICNYSMGLAGEAGEVIDYIKKVIFHYHELDTVKLAEELGDCLFYLAAIASEIGMSLNDIAKQNYQKLLVRYPDGFSSERSICRERG